ncbi:MAG TPA: hypothetical protein VJY62_07750 [Bacteroidia bacterium]|nr:hypothetical protein [Bacteroidia bacterium]
MARTNWKKLRKQSEEYVRIGQRGVDEAIKDSFSKGIPVVFGREGKIIWQYPDGYETTKSPFKKVKGKQEWTAEAERRRKKYFESLKGNKNSKSHKETDS